VVIGLAGSRVMVRASSSVKMHVCPFPP